MTRRLLTCAGMIAVCAALISTGCATSAMSSGPGYMASGAYREREEVASSLFASDQATISNEDIAKILSGRITLPAEARVAVLQLGSSAYVDAEAGQMCAMALSEALHECSRVKDVSPLPSLLVPARPSVSLLREAAARFQAHLLVVYKIDADYYHQYRAFRYDKAKAYCKVEVVVLDVLTGVVPFASTATGDFEVTHTSEDYSYSETVSRGVKGAIQNVTAEVSADLTTFLNAVP